MNAFDNPNYSVPDATAATKTETPIVDTPASIEVVPRAVIDDRKENDLSEVVENVSGVWFVPNLGGYSSFTIRGFNTTAVYRDELRVGPAGLWVANTFDTSNLQSVEVLKGPAAMLYGRGEPGGLIAMVTKKPLDTPHSSVEQQVRLVELLSHARGHDGSDRQGQDAALSLYGSLPDQQFDRARFRVRRPLEFGGRPDLPAQRLD